jgi:preprotein translocase subunit SecG
MMIETLLAASIWHYISAILMSATAIFLILLVLVQRGRGGGLAGAFGGMGGQSAFGTKAGDTFTKVTIGVSIFWILLCLASVKFLGSNTGSFGAATAPDQTQVGPLGTAPEDSTTPPLGTSPSTTPPPADTTPTDTTPDDSPPPAESNPDSSEE